MNEERIDLTGLQSVELIIGYSNLLCSQETWSASINGMHAAFSELKARYSEFFTDIWFDENLIKPYSRSVDSALSCLMTIGIAYVNSPKYDTIYIEKKYKDEIIAHLSKDLPDKIMSQGKEISKKFDEIIENFEKAK